MNLTVYTVNASLGLYRVKNGRKTLTVFVLPSYMVSLGLPPTRDDVLGAIRQLFPDLPISPDVPITFAD